MEGEGKEYGPDVDRGILPTRGWYVREGVRLGKRFRRFTRFT